MAGGIAIAVAFLLCVLPVAQAGSQGNPEAVDRKGDVTLQVPVFPPPTPPTFGFEVEDGAVDILAAWFTQDNSSLYVHLQVQAYQNANLRSSLSYDVAVLVDGSTGECTQDGSTSLGFALKAYDSATARTGALESNYRWTRSPVFPCESHNDPIPFKIVNNVLTWTVPKTNLHSLKPDSLLQFRQVHAFASRTQSEDWLDDIPGRPFILHPLPHSNATFEPEAWLPAGADSGPAEPEPLSLMLAFLAELLVACVATAFAIWRAESPR